LLETQFVCKEGPVASTETVLQLVSCAFFVLCTGRIANDSSWLRLVDFQELAKGFAALAPVRVLWNLQGGVPGGAEDVQLGGNTRVVGWIDYNVSGTCSDLPNHSVTWRALSWLLLWTLSMELWLQLAND
jgi:hypothetical protein